MGTRTMMSKVLAALLIAFLVGTYTVEEVQELGNKDAASNLETAMDTAEEDSEDELGEGVGARGGFLSTTGSFTLSSGGPGNEEDEDELGEGVGARGGFLSTTGSFTLSSGGPGNEEDEDLE